MRQRYWPLAGLAVLFALFLGGLAVRLSGLTAAGESVLWLVFSICGAVLTGAALAVMADRFIRYGGPQVESAGLAESDWRKAVEAAPVALAIYDADRGLVFGNGPWRALFKESGGPARGPTGEHRLTDGTRFRLDEAPLDGGGRLVVAVDTTDAHRQADLARGEIEKLRLVLSATGAWIWETDVLHRFSAAAPLQAGLSDEDLQWMIGRDLAELVALSDGNSDAVLSSCIRDMNQRRDLLDVALVLRHGTGHRTVRLNGVPRTGGDGAFLGYCGVGVFEAVQPSARPESAPEPLLPGEPSAGLGRRILLVDDSGVNRKLGLSFLKKMGYEADAVEGGQEALDAVRGGEYCLVLMDIWMPGMDGFEATMKLRQLPEPVGSIPVVAMTAHVGARDRQRCFDSGMNDHVAKPVDRRVLSAVLQRLIGPPNGGAPGDVIDPGVTRETADTGAVAALLDRAILEQLRIDAGPGLLGELIAAFMAETDERLPRMRAALESGDLDAVAEETHAMKSTSGTFGALRLQMLAERVHSAARQSDSGLTSELFAGLPGLAAESWREFARSGYLPP